MIGSILLAIGLLAIGSLQIAAIRGNTFSGDLMQATYVAQDRFEFLRNLPFDHSLLNEGSHQDGDVTVLGIMFKRSYSIAFDGSLKTIHYAVSWNDNRDHTLTFSTVRSQ